MRWQQPILNRPYHGIGALLKFDQTQKQNTPLSTTLYKIRTEIKFMYVCTRRSKPKLVSGPIVRVMFDRLKKVQNSLAYN